MNETLSHYCTSPEGMTRLEHEQSFPKGDTTYLLIVGSIKQVHMKSVSGRSLDQYGVIADDP